MPNFRKELVQYVFIDVVAFTHEKRTVEDMVGIITTLNTIVLQVLEENDVTESDRILIPTGDGMCICLLNQRTETRHIQIAVALREYAASAKQDAQGTGTEFDLHIGVHEGKDLIIHDINGRENIIGAGINIAARLMGECPAGEIYVSSVVHDGVHRYADYHGAFRRSQFTDKSGEVIQHYILGNAKDTSIFALRRMVDKLGFTIGGPLRRDDITALKPKDYIFHKVYGVGQIQSIAGLINQNMGPLVTIKFHQKLHTVRLTNSKGNYFKCIPLR